MTPVIPYSISNVSLIPGTVFTRKAGSSTRFSLSKKISVKTPCILLPRSASFPLLLRSRSRVCSASATETDVAVEEPETPVAGEAEEGSSAEPEAPALAKAQSKRARPKKSEFPPVKNEDLVAGAWFDGKVVSVQPFGAFVDFGAFTDGLVHVSQLSDGFVKEVGSVVSVGQEVKVRLIETVAENGRISLSLLSGEDSGKEQSSQRRESSGGPGRKGDSKPPRRGDPKKVSKFSKGQDLEGTVKNMNRAGAFVSLPEGEEGFLPVAEELDDGFGTMMGETTLEVGQEVSVRVLKIARGQVTLTMKKEEDIPKTNVQVSQGVMHTASNPFLLAFRKNKDIAAFLDEREKKVETETVAPEESVDEKVETEASSLVEAPKESEIEVASEPVLEEPVAEKVEAEASSFEEAPKETENEILSEAVPEEPVTEKVEPEASTLEEAPKESENEVVSEAVVEEPVEEKVEAESSTPEEAPKASENEVVSEAVPDATDEKVETQAEVSSEAPSTNEVSEEQPEEATAKDEPPVETPAEETQVPSSATTETPSQRPKASISPALVKQLREETGAGMMDCKNALSESGGDMAKAQEYLRKKGLAGAEKKASRATAEGRVGSYIHDSRIGVLVEVNCETDFVSRGDIFRELVDDVAMQVAACPQVLHISTEDVPQETVTKEREIEMQKEDLASKPEQMRERIVDGRIKKRLDELTLLEQPYIKNDKVVVKDFVKQTIATVGENIQVRRFVRFNLGEGLEKKSQDFAAEVAAQTSTKPAAPKPQGTAETEPTVEKAPPAVAVSAALVKQLRDESGAGMMDCKKALSESGGDLEKAQEYLRKKGLASADKKSSRIAAEGRIGSYIHDSRIGVLIEVNCETDFVSRGDRFKELVDDLAMQVAACPQVSFVSLEEIGAEVAQREKAAEMQREDLQSKPESIRERIVEGRVAKRLGELALLEQPFIKDDSLLVKDLVRQTIAALGENIRVRRFVRFTLGEKLDGQESSS